MPELSTKERLSPPAHWDWHVTTPFSQGWRAGDFVYVGGQLSATETGEVIGRGDIELQTRNVFENISKVLEQAGATWADVIKLNTYYVFDGPPESAQSFWEKMTRIRLDYVQNPGPAATAIRVAGLMYDGFLIEADVVAYIGKDRE